MADKPQAKNELGQLFVDIGIGGLGKTLKGLNSVAASFLLGKNAANQFVQTMSQPFKQAGNNAIAIGKMSTALSTTREEYQKLVQYIKNNGLDESLIGDIANLENIFKNAIYNNLPQQMMLGLGRLGIDPQKYVNERGSFKSILNLIDEIDTKSKNLSLDERNQILGWLQMSPDWGYLWDEGKKISDYYTVSTKNLQANEDLAKSMSEFSITLNNFKENVLAELSPTLIKFINSMTDWIKSINPDKIADVIDDNIPQNKEDINFLNFLMPTKHVADNIKRKQAAKKNANNMPPKEFPTGMAADLGYMGTLPEIAQGAKVPPNLSGMIQNNTNNLYQDITINGDNSREIAQEVARVTKQDIEYLQFQATNLPGQ